MTSRVDLGCQRAPGLLERNASQEDRRGGGGFNSEDSTLPASPVAGFGSRHLSPCPRVIRSRFYMQFGVCLPHRWKYASARLIADVAQEAESLRFDSVWVTDHVIVPVHHVERGHIFYEALMTLAFVSSITRTVAMGTTVLATPTRNPVVLAREGRDARRAVGRPGDPGPRHRMDPGGARGRRRGVDGARPILR